MDDFRHFLMGVHQKILNLVQNRLVKRQLSRNDQQLAPHEFHFRPNRPHAKGTAGTVCLDESRDDEGSQKESP